MSETEGGFGELLAYTDGETERWHAWLRQQPPEVREVRIGEGTRETVRDMIGHVFMVELRYAQRLLNRPVTAYEEVDMSSLDALWGIHAQARAALREYLAAHPAGERERQMTFDTRTLGTLHASAYKVVMHSFIHGIRHWAQIATALRQAGHPQGWEHDWLMSDAVSDPHPQHRHRLQLKDAEGAEKHFSAPSAHLRVSA